MQSTAATLDHAAAPDWAAIVAVTLGVTTFTVAQGLTYPLLSLVMESRAVPDALIGLNAGAFAAGIAVSTLAVRRLTALASGDRLIIASLLVASLCLATFAVSESFLVWTASRFVLGFAVSVIHMMSEAWLHAAVPDRLRGRVTGVYGGCMCAGFAAGPLAIPLFGTESGFAFAMVAVYVALVGFLTALLTRRTRTRPAPAPGGALLLFSRQAPLLVAMVAAFGFADITAIAVMPVYFVKTGHSDAFAAVSVTAMALSTAAAQPLVGLLLDRLPRKAVTAAAAALAAGSYLALPLLDWEPGLLAVFALMGIAAFALYTCALTLLGSQFTGGLLVAGGAAFSLAYAVGSGAGSSATAFAMDLAGAAAAPLSAGLVLAAFAAVLLLSRR